MYIEKERGSVFCNFDAWEQFTSRINSLQPSKIFILTDTNTNKHCLPYFLKKTGISNAIPFQMAAGESNKNFSTCLTLWEFLSTKGADRKSLLINLGGGIVTDLGGFVACTLKRGIEFINVPTSLLAMVDASVGGKNGVDLGFLKNQIGIIKNPIQVIIDTQFLATLPEPHIKSGYAEMLKHALIYSESYWEELKRFDASDTEKTAAHIWKSVEIKNEIVTKDPGEHSLRKTLNYGHTLGHAIESHWLEKHPNNPLLHGEAIAVGMVLATYISSELFRFPKNKLTEIATTLKKHYRFVQFSKKDIETIISLLIYDKKNQNGIVYFVLLEDFAIPHFNCEVPNELIHKAFDFYKNN